MNGRVGIKTASIADVRGRLYCSNVTDTCDVHAVLSEYPIVRSTNENEETTKIKIF